jgi:hypothetical protein
MLSALLGWGRRGWDVQTGPRPTGVVSFRRVVAGRGAGEKDEDACGVARIERRDGVSASSSFSPAQWGEQNSRVRIGCGGTIKFCCCDHGPREVARASEKIVSLFEPHTDIIIKDRRDTPYGHKICLTSGASGIVTDVVLLRGNPADSTLAVTMIERQKQLFGNAPLQASFDGGFASRDNLADIKNLGVQDVAFSKRCRLEISDMVKSSWVYRQLKNFRAGIEAGVSFLKRAFGLDRCLWRGLESFRGVQRRNGRVCLRAPVAYRRAVPGRPCALGRIASASRRARCASIESQNSPILRLVCCQTSRNPGPTDRPLAPAGLSARQAGRAFGLPEGRHHAARVPCRQARPRSLRWRRVLLGLGLLLQRKHEGCHVRAGIDGSCAVAGPFPFRRIEHRGRGPGLARGLHARHDFIGGPRLELH